MKIKLLLLLLSFISINTYSQVSSGSFTVGGSSASYYPVLFSVSGVDGPSSLGKLSVYIPHVHANGLWSGMFHSDVEFISSNYGHTYTKMVEFTYVIGGGNAYSDPIGDIIDGSTQGGSSQLVMWLKGGATYQWSTSSNSRVSLMDGNPQGTTKTSDGGNPLSILTTQSELVTKAKNAKFYPSVGLGTNGNGYFGGNVGIGTTKPSSKLVIAEGTNGVSINSGDVSGIGFNRNVSDGTIYNSNLSGWQFSARDERFSLEGYNGAASVLLNVLKNGNVGIGSQNPDQKLTVKGKIHAEEVIIDLAVPADYVFKPNYKLMPLPQVEQFVKTNSHLPEIPSASEITKNGLNIGEMQNKLLQKVEELTLYSIEQEKGRKVLEEKLAIQEKQYNALLQKVDMLTKQQEKK